MCSSSRFSIWELKKATSSLWRSQPSTTGHYWTVANRRLWKRILKWRSSRGTNTQLSRSSKDKEFHLQYLRRVKAYFNFTKMRNTTYAPLSLVCLSFHKVQMSQQFKELLSKGRVIDYLRWRGTTKTKEFQSGVLHSHTFSAHSPSNCMMLSFWNK